MALQYRFHRPVQDQSVELGQDEHSYPQLMKDSPCCFIFAKSKNLLKPQGANTMFLGNHLPYSSKPYLQRYTSILKNSPCCSRNPGPTTFTSVMLGLASFHNPIFLMVAMWTNKSFWPSHLIKIFLARLFSDKTFFELKHRFRIVFHSPDILYVGAVVVKGITLKLNLLLKFLSRTSPMPYARSLEL